MTIRDFSFSQYTRYSTDLPRTRRLASIVTPRQRHSAGVFQQLGRQSIYISRSVVREVLRRGLSVSYHPYSLEVFREIGELDLRSADCRRRDSCAGHTNHRGLLRASIPMRCDGRQQVFRPTSSDRSLRVYLLSTASRHRHRRSGQLFPKKLQLVFRGLGSYTDWASQNSFEVSSPRLFQQRGGSLRSVHYTTNSAL